MTDEREREAARGEEGEGKGTRMGDATTGDAKFACLLACSGWLAGAPRPMVLLCAFSPLDTWVPVSLNLQAVFER